MKTSIRNLRLLILVVAAFCGLGVAQEAPPEKHVKDIRTEQTQEVILASPLCQRTRENPHTASHIRSVAPATLEPDLSSLMEKSDEVILVGDTITSTEAISPSQQDVVKYYDVQVLRSWKGSHKVGDLLTFALPNATVRCTTSLANGEPTFTTLSGVSGLKGPVWGAFVLFLRHSQGDEAQLTPGLRLTGGDGLQGMFQVSLDLHSHICNVAHPRKTGECSAFLEASDIPVVDLYVRDPLSKEYDGMPISSFLQEVQATADSLGYATQANATK